MSATASRSMCGEILTRRKIVAPADLDRALVEQGRSMLPLLSTVLQMGLADEGTLASVLSEQAGVPGVDLGATVIDTEVLSLVPQDLARSHHLLPIGRRDKTLQLAVGSAEQHAMLDEIAFATGLEVLPFVALRGPLDAAIDAAWTARKNGESMWKGARAATATAPVAAVRTALRDAPRPEPSIPEAPLPPLEPLPTAPPRPQGAPARVLVVDDEEAILDLVQKALSSRGIEVLRATRGRQALEMVRQSMPDVVLLDAMLPEVHGFEICSKIKGSDGFRHIPVIIISAIYTGWNLAADVKRLYGADDFMAKPFRVMELVRKVEEQLERIKARPRARDVEAANREAVREAKAAAELFQGGRLEEARQAAERAVKADAFDARAHFILGSVMQGLGDVYKAISEFERVVELAPTMFGALKNLAVLYERQGFRSKAVEMWTRALDQSPSDAVRQTIKAHIIGLL